MFVEIKFKEKFEDFDIIEDYKNVEVSVNVSFNPFILWMGEDRKENFKLVVQ